MPTGIAYPASTEGVEMTSPHHGTEQSLSAEIRSSALLIGLLVAVILLGLGIGLLASLAS